MCDFKHVTVPINNTPIEVIIDSGSTLTLISQRLFNKISQGENYNTNYKDVKDDKMEFVGQTNAMVKTNKTTLQVPLLITQVNITPLWRLE